MKDDILNYDEKRFREVLRFIDNNRQRMIPTTGEDLIDNFGDDIFQTTRRLEEKQYVIYDKRKQCFYIKDAGIEALRTIYNIEWIKQNEKEKNEIKEIEERRHIEILEEQKKSTRNQWIGIVIAGIIGFAGVVIAIFK